MLVTDVQDQAIVVEIQSHVVRRRPIREVCGGPFSRTTPEERLATIGVEIFVIVPVASRERREPKIIRAIAALLIPVFPATH